MNMSKSIYMVLFIILSFFVLNVRVEAADDCNSKYLRSKCEIDTNCQWDEVEDICVGKYVAENPCSDNNIKTVLRFFGYLLMIAKVAIPVILIFMGTFDLFKSVVDKDEKSLGKQVKLLLIRIVAGVFVFFIPTIVYALFSISSDLKIVEEAKYKTCVDCVLNPTICITK